MEILFLAQNPAGFKEFLEIPLLTKVEEITKPVNDEEFATITGQPLNLIGGEGLRTFSFSSFFPSKAYRFIDARKLRPLSEYIRFFEYYQEKRIPIRVVVWNGFHSILNMECRFNFTYKPADRAGDIPYTLELKEYKRASEGRWFDAF